MKSIAYGSIDKPLLVWVLMLFCLLGGLWGFNSVGRLEDPAFTIKEAVVVTAYPGATAAEVATEVTEPLESAIQQMGEVKDISSRNRNGVSEITVEIESTFDGDALPQIWDELRAKVADAADGLPSGVQEPLVNDGFGDVFGIFYAVSAPGFTDAEIHQVSSFLRRELLTVDGVADVELRGLPEEAIFVQPSLEQTVNLGVSPNAIVEAVVNSDAVTPAGSTRNGDNRLSIEAPSGDDSVEEISALTIGVRGEVLNLLDIATVERGRVDEPAHIIRHNGVEAFTLGVSGVDGVNIVDVGFAIEAKLDSLASAIPVGVDIQPIYEQHRVVDDASNAFLLNLAMSVGIVIFVLGLFMGVRAAIVVGATLLLTVIATFFFMAIFGIQMERISLGALIIAMGMLVDNAIVVAEGMQVLMRQGKSAREAAGEVAGKTSMPLLGATVIGIMAFAGIGLSPDATGEFLFSLFAVIGISLLLSWILAVSVTPLLAKYFFRVGGLPEGGDAYGGAVFQGYAALLRGALRARMLVILALIGVTVACYAAFGFVKQQFFPFSTTPLFYAHYQIAQGSSIQETSEDLAILEDWLLEREDVVAVTTTVGQGLTRFMLTYGPARRDSAYGQLVIRTETTEELDAVKADLVAFAAAALPEGETRVQRLVFGPSAPAEIEARLIGPDPDTLRALAVPVAEEMRAISAVKDVRLDWRERSFALRPQYATDRAQAAGVTREAVATALLTASDGLPAGEYREDDRLIPIILRLPEEERIAVAGTDDLVVFSNATQSFVPLAQVVDGFTLEPRDGLIHRLDREVTLTIQADTSDGVTPETAFAELQPAVEAIDLPVGYRIEWGGTYEASTEAQTSLGRQMPLSFLTMLVLTVLLFGKLKQTAVVWLLVPMAVNGVAVGLLVADLPFSFTALLGLLSLSGMLLKNGIVLIEEIDAQREEHEHLSDAVVTASVSRLRPVVLAAATTIIGMTPLLGDAFFASMAVTIMGGLAFASVLTLIAAPVFYVSMFGRARRAERAARQGERSAPPPPEAVPAE